MISFALIFYLFFNLAFADVLIFKDSDFHQKVKEHSFILIKFYAPWCGHCKRLAPEFELAANRLSSHDPPLSLAKVDCTTETKICGEVGVTGYPTLKIYRNGELAQDYDGPRTADGIYEYIITRSGPSSKSIQSLEEFNKILYSDKPIVLGYFKSEDSELAKIFLKIADESLSDFKFSHTTSNIFGAENELIRIYPSLKFKSKLEPNYIEYSSEADKFSIKAWIENNAHGICGLRTPNNQRLFKQPLVTIYHTFDYEKDPKGSAYWRNRVLKIAKEHKEIDNKLNFAVSNRDLFSYELSNFGIEHPFGDKPYAAILSEKEEKFVLNESFDWDTLRNFLKAYRENSLIPYLKSEPVPTENPEAVKKVVAKTFDQIVNDPTKDVLIEFYAEWCGHCKKLKPIYEELASKLKDESEIVIASIEATKNDVPKPYEVHGFPTIYFAKRGSKATPAKYEGGRELDELISYVAEHSTNELSGYDRKGKSKKLEL